MKTIKENLAVVKEVLKVEAEELATLKREIKKTQKSGKYAGNMQCDLECKRYKWRHKFLAYCTLRGRSIEDVERTNREGNQPNIGMVERYRREIVGDDNA